ncbi:U7 snRNA-associated Sm-like protein LSm10 [Mya arenaria]|uniref:U7 snRNA-associated Sm-like protein LSm10 n=1 Tax=Mya arenaria TaxID=6604 RepID=UPI0022E58CCC|nr:U7 snRNA-associated Sm-like protein LSm10 [Mya arenaria]
METPREKFYFTNTMLCLLKVVEGMETTVELHGEKEVTGRVVHVDGYMNITMHHVTIKYPRGSKKFDEFFVNGRQVRYVHIPDTVDIKKAMEAEIMKRNYNVASERVKQEIKDAAWKKMMNKEKQRKHQKKIPSGDCLADDAAAYRGILQNAQAYASTLVPPKLQMLDSRDQGP